MDITFTLNKETLEALLDAFNRDLVVYEGVVRDIKANIARIQSALSPVKRQTVRSEHDYNRNYVVTRTDVGDATTSRYVYECSCPSYQYTRGLDADGHCKHIRSARTMPTRWA